MTNHVKKGSKLYVYADLLNVSKQTEMHIVYMLEHDI